MSKTFDKTLRDLHKSFSMLSQEEQKYANVFIHDVQSGNAHLIPEKTFREYITDMMKAAENDRIKRVVKRLGCYEKLLREMMEQKVTKETIQAHGKYKELKDSVDKKKAMHFFFEVEKNDFQPERLAMYVDSYLRRFILSGGDDPYPDAKSVHGQVIKEQEGKYEVDEQKKDIAVILTDEDMVGKKTVSNVSQPLLSGWYSSSKAVASMMTTGCFAYLNNKLCINDAKYVVRDDNGKMCFTQYALDHEEECFLQFIVDENGKLHYVTLPKAMASNSFKYTDEITEEIARQYGLVNEISSEMLTAINGLEFGEALARLMSKNICGFSVGLLKSTTGLDNKTVSNMRKGENLSKLNVVSA